MKVTDTSDRVVVFDDYPVNKFAKKIDWWTSDQGLEVIAGWRQCGATIRDIVAKMGVDPRTFNAWRKKCPKLDELLTTGREVTNSRVVSALYKRAVGFYYVETVSELVEGEMRVVREVKKYCPPDTKAALSWLFSRWPDAWRAIQPPLDSDGPTIAAAEDMLVNIRKAALLAAGQDPATNPGEKPEAKESTTESAGE